MRVVQRYTAAGCSAGVGIRSGRRDHTLIRRRPHPRHMNVHVLSSRFAHNVAVRWFVDGVAMSFRDRWWQVQAPCCSAPPYNVSRQQYVRKRVLRAAARNTTCAHAYPANVPGIGCCGESGVVQCSNQKLQYKLITASNPCVPQRAEHNASA